MKAFTTCSRCHERIEGGPDSQAWILHAATHRMEVLAADVEHAPALDLIAVARASHPPEPTPDQLDARAKFEWNGRQCMALWYPQMGGYVGRAVAVRASDPDLSPCYDVFVWHDGEFPFSENDGREAGEPRRLHHCDPGQFIDFGEQLIEWEEQGTEAAGDVAEPTAQPARHPFVLDLLDTDGRACLHCGGGVADDLHNVGSTAPLSVPPHEVLALMAEHRMVLAPTEDGQWTAGPWSGRARDVVPLRLGKGATIGDAVRDSAARIRRLSNES